MHKKVQVYPRKNTVRKNKKNTFNNYGIIQSCYTLSNKNNGGELMFLLSIGLSRLINKLSLISNRNVLAPWARMVSSSNEGSWLQNRRWPRIELSADGLTFLEVNEEMSMCSLLSSACQFHHNRKHCIFYTEIYLQRKR